jgi:hypothetical protein
MQPTFAFFWTIAIMKMVLSAPVHVAAVRAARPRDVALGLSQRKDDWLASAVMALAVLGDSQPVAAWLHEQLGDGGLPWRTLLYAAGALLLAWLARRAQARRQMLREAS